MCPGSWDTFSQPKQTLSSLLLVRIFAECHKHFIRLYFSGDDFKAFAIVYCKEGLPTEREHTAKQLMLFALNINRKKWKKKQKVILYRWEWQLLYTEAHIALWMNAGAEWHRRRRRWKAYFTIPSIFRFLFVDKATSRACGYIITDPFEWRMENRGMKLVWRMKCDMHLVACIFIILHSKHAQNRFRLRWIFIFICGIRGILNKLCIFSGILNMFGSFFEAL